MFTSGSASFYTHVGIVLPTVKWLAHLETKWTHFFILHFRLQMAKQLWKLIIFWGEILVYHSLCLIIDYSLSPTFLSYCCYDYKSFLLAWHIWGLQWRRWQIYITKFVVFFKQYIDFQCRFCWLKCCNCCCQILCLTSWLFKQIWVPVLDWNTVPGWLFNISSGLVLKWGPCEMWLKYALYDMISC